MKNNIISLITYQAIILVLGIGIHSPHLLLCQTVTYQNLHNNTTFENKSINKTLPVGSVQGVATVSQGIANYTFPIQLPAGTNSTVPSLSVGYQSQGGDGFLGLGWNILGLSSITRNIKSFYHDGFVGPATLDAADRFAVDGVRLIATSGSYGVNGTTYSKESEDFSRTTSYGISGTGPTYFKVEMKDGTILEYGNTFDSRVMAQNNQDVLLWRLNRIIYKDGNYIDYIYETISDENRIKEIKYTGNLLANPQLIPYNIVKFEYSSRNSSNNFKNTNYEIGKAIKLNSLLTKIVISTENELFKSYEFNYANDNINVYLNEVKEIGADGVSALNSTVFKYGDDPTHIVEVSAPGITTSSSLGVELVTGDFNGDGYTDLLRGNRIILDNKVFQTGFSVFSKVPSDLGGSFSWKYTKTFPANLYGSVNIYGTKHNYLSSDFNGDGIDDIAIPLTSNTLYPFRFEYLKIYLNNSSLTNPTELNINLPIVDVYRMINVDKKFFQIGDFDGDGIKDVIIITTIGLGLPTSKAYIWYGNSSATEFIELTINGSSHFAINNWETKNLNVLDFDGDGKDELMITKGSYSEIFSISGTQAKSEHIAGFPTEYHLMLFGDFNGDRKTDMLVRPSLNDNQNNWKVATSTGKSWVETDFSFFFRVPEVNEHYQGDKIVIADFNGDGKSDIVHHYNNHNVSNSSDVQVYYSTGSSFHLKTRNILANQTSNNPVGDFNGDGMTDICDKSTVSSTLRIFYMNNNSQKLLLQRVKNGEGHITQFNYNRINRSGSHYSKTSFNYPYTSLSVPMFVVTSLYKDGFAETNYSYHNAILHRRGRGFLGFLRITESGPKSSTSNRRGESSLRTYSGPQRFDHIQHNYFNLNNQHSMLVLDSVINLYGNERLNKKTITNQIIQQNSGNLQKILWHRTPVVRDENIKENTVSLATNSLYDTDGNVLSSNIIFYRKLSNYSLYQVERITTTSVFEMHGSFRKNVPGSVTTETVRAGQPTYSKQIKFNYNSLGQLTSQIDFNGLSKALTQSYTYNSFGNIESTTISSNGLTSRTSTNYYDSKGRFIQTSYNAANQVSTALYDKRWAKPIETVGVDGIITEYEYDGFGRLKKTIYRKGLQDEFFTTYDYTWNSFGNNYFIRYNHPGKPDTKVYYDNLGRKTAVETEGFQNHWIRETFLYDGHGNVVLHYGPHRPSLSEVGMATSSVYDEYGRLEEVSNTLSTTKYSYSYVNGTKVITETLDLPLGQTDQITTKSYDPTGKLTSASDDQGTLYYYYFSHGNLNQVINSSGTVISSMLYDEYGRQTRLTDINSGVTDYEYNGFGELIFENQPSNNNVSIVYNVLGNIISRTGTEGTTNYIYYNAGVKINKIEKITSFTNGYEEIFNYDNTYGRLTSKIEKINNINYTTAFTYNKYDDLLTTTYPSGVVITNEYDQNGFISKIKNGSTTLFTNQGMTPYNNYKTYQYGNGLITDVTYHQTFPTRFYSRNSNATTKRQDLNLVWNYATGNLQSRNDAIVNRTETFTYDSMNRLTSSKVGTNTTIYYNFSSDGNMIVKSDIAGSQGLEYLLPKRNAVSKIQNPISIPFNTQTITYTPYQRPSLISESNQSVEFNYGSDYERRMAVFKTNNSTTQTRIYLGNFERQVIGSTTNDVHYVSNGERLIAIVVKTGSTITNNYVHTDHLGSILAVTNSTMGIVAQQNYDAWGRKRNVSTWTYASVNSVPTWLFRGFTGHEEYLQFNIINMNARLYDPMNGRMLSPDILVSMPYSSQGYNRYSYANNNPLKYIDPDGNEPFSMAALGIAMLKAAAVSVAMNGISNAIQERPFFDGWLKAAAIGAVTGGVSHSIGFLTSTMMPPSVYSATDRAIAQALMHGWSGALFTVLQGGNPAKGYASGVASSITASSIQSLGGGKIATFIGGGLSGGVGAAVVGGDFYQGATFGLISTGLNHLAHEGSIVFQKGIIGIRKAIAQNALKKVGSTEYNYDVAKDNFGENTNKCNKFVFDVLLESGADPGTPNGFFKTSPPTAGQWADPDYSIPGWKTVDNPRPGDVVAYAYNYSDATGHVAIVVSNSRALRFSVGTSGTYNSVAKTQFGFIGSLKPAGATYVFKRYFGN